MNVKIPSFKFENTIDDIQDILSEAGYGILFDRDMGMFTQMLSHDGQNMNLAISKIIQMDAIELDENGTKASASTSGM